jgi:hypothetical protein
MKINRDKVVFIISLMWMLAFFLRSGIGTSSKGLFFLFGVDSSFIQEREPEYSKCQLWEMHTGAWAVFGTVFFIILMVISILNIRKANREKSSEQASRKKLHSNKNTYGIIEK